MAKALTVSNQRLGNGGAQLDGPEGSPEPPMGMERALTQAMCHVTQRDPRPIVFFGPAGVGKTTCALALAERLKRPVAAFDVAVSGLRAGQRDGLRELPLIPRRVRQSGGIDGGAAPIIVIDRPERLPGDLPGHLMAGLAYIAAERFPQALREYFGVEFHPEQTLIVFTTRSGFVSALKSRLFFVQLHGYCTTEKVAIAGGLFEAAGRRVPAALVQQLVQTYAKGPGMDAIVALLNRTRHLSDAEMVPGRIAALVSAPPPSLAGPLAASLPGHATAMAWTPEGGTHLVIEATFGNPGDGDLTTLGMLGDEMHGAAEVAIHVVNNSLNDPALLLGTANGRPVFLNLPGSWTHKKDGRSAGLAMALALYGLATGRRPRPRRAATGELSLGGLVLSVGTCVAKLLGAECEGITEVLMPRASAGELRDASPLLRATISVQLVDTFSEAIALWFQ